MMRRRYVRCVLNIRGKGFGRALGPGSAVDLDEQLGGVSMETLIPFTALHPDGWAPKTGEVAVANPTAAAPRNTRTAPSRHERDGEGG